LPYPVNKGIIGIVAGALSCTTFLPQLIKTWKPKSTKDVSLVMFLIASAGITWLVHGIVIHSISIIGTNIFILIYFADNVVFDFQDQGEK
jgi:MtN3 and saliva related transmembrane protein